MAIIRSYWYNNYQVHLCPIDLRLSLDYTDAHNCINLQLSGYTDTHNCVNLRKSSDFIDVQNCVNQQLSGYTDAHSCILI